MKFAKRLNLRRPPEFFRVWQDAEHSRNIKSVRAESTQQTLSRQIKCSERILKQ